MEELEKEEVIDDKIREGIRFFNKKGKHGIQYLQSEGIITKDSKSIAEFLMHFSERLSKSELGDFLVEEDMELLLAFAELMNFVGISFFPALRDYLSRFMIPDDASNMSRVIEPFAVKYVSDNPGLFPNEDALFVLAFSLLMLNTDHHQSAYLDKMTKDQYVRNCRGSWGGEDPPQELLEAVYDDIVCNEIKMKRKGDPKRDWIKAIKASSYEQGRCWMCLFGNQLRWYKNATVSEKELGYITLEYVMVKEEEDRFLIASALPKSIEFYVYDKKGNAVPMKAMEFGITCEKEHVENWATAVRQNVTFGGFTPV